jgi:hypothetical protein
MQQRTIASEDAIDIRMALATLHQADVFLKRAAGSRENTGADNNVDGCGRCGQR